MTVHNRAAIDSFMTTNAQHSMQLQLQLMIAASTATWESTVKPKPEKCSLINCEGKVFLFRTKAIREQFPTNKFYT